MSVKRRRNVGSTNVLKLVAGGVGGGEGISQAGLLTGVLDGADSLTIVS